MGINIEQHHRRELPQGTAGNVIAPRTDSYGELGNLGDKLTQLGMASFELNLKAKYYNEKSNAQLQIDKKFLEYEDSLDPNNTEEWIANLEKMQESFGEIKVTSQRLKAELPTMLEEAKLRQRSSLSNYQNVVDARNITRDLQTNFISSQDITATTPIDSEGDRKQSQITWLDSLFGLELINPAGEVVKENLQAIEGRDDPLMRSDKVKIGMALAWNEGENQKRHDFVIKKVTEELLQNPNEAYINNPNKYLKDMGIEGKFEPDDVAALNKAYRQGQNIIEGQKVERAQQFDKETRRRILQGGSQEELQKLRQEILGNPDISGPQLNTLVNLYDSRIDGMGKKYTDDQKYAAYVKIQEEADPEKKMKLLAEHAGGLGFTKAASIYDDITDPTTANDPILPDILGTIDDVYSYSRGVIQKGEKKPEEIQKDIALAGLDTTRLKAQVIEQDKRLIKEGKTPQQRIDAAEALIAPAKEDAAKEIVKTSFWGRAKQNIKELRAHSSLMSLTPGLSFKGKKEKSPYDEYPDAFQEDGAWKVIKNGKKYRIED